MNGVFVILLLSGIFGFMILVFIFSMIRIAENIRDEDYEGAVN
ncbi:hypothetical protein ES702_02157 [subsurface metagenome]